MRGILVKSLRFLLLEGKAARFISNNTFNRLTKMGFSKGVVED